MEKTAIAWSITTVVRSHGLRGVQHMQGGAYGKPARTMCGRTFNGAGLWDFDVIDSPPEQFEGCERCRAAYRRYSCRGKPE